MCKLIVIINQNRRSEAAINDLITANAAALMAERSGYSIYTSNNDTTEGYFDYRPGYFEKNIRYRYSPVAIYHFRTATSGAIGKNGLHLQRLYGRYVYAHNGWITMYRNVADKNDSHYFFDNFLKNRKKVKFGALAREISRAGFNGRGTLYDAASRTLHLWSTETLYLTILANCLIFSSFQLSTEKITQHKSRMLSYTYQHLTYQPITAVIAQEKLTRPYLFFIGNQLADQKKIKPPHPVGRDYYLDYNGGGASLYEIQ